MKNEGSRESKFIHFKEAWREEKMEHDNYSRHGS